MVTELALQILRLQSTATVLLVAPSNSATDTLCLRLREAFDSAAGLGQRSAMLRLNDRERTFAEVPDAMYVPTDSCLALDVLILLSVAQPTLLLYRRRSLCGSVGD